jgi:hypothetical protein
MKASRAGWLVVVCERSERLVFLEPQLVIRAGFGNVLQGNAPGRKWMTVGVDSPLVRDFWGPLVHDYWRELGNLGRQPGRQSESVWTES